MGKAQFYVMDKDIEFNEVKINSHGNEQSIYLEKYPVDIDRKFDVKDRNGQVEIDFVITQSVKLDLGKEVLTSNRGFIKVEELNKDDEIMVIESNGISGLVNNFSGEDMNDISNLEEFGIYANKFKILVRK